MELRVGRWDSMDCSEALAQGSQTWRAETSVDMLHGKLVELGYTGVGQFFGIALGS